MWTGTKRARGSLCRLRAKITPQGKLDKAERAASIESEGNHARQGK